VRIAGRKEVVGRPFLYCTTREFLVHFGLKSLKDLPPLEEFEESFEDGAEGEAAAEPGLDAGPGRDREEVILRRAADLEELQEATAAAAGEASGPAGETTAAESTAGGEDGSENPGEHGGDASDTLEGERADEPVPAGSPS
jgi:segregation and condensation protein B